MNTAWFCVTVLGCLVLNTTDAVLGTAWTTPGISSINGTGTIAKALKDGANTSFPQLVATGATNYVITSQDPAGIFEITAGTGQLALAATKEVDYETASKHVLIVTADDGSTTGTATITINIAQVNKNPPVFTASSYSACVVDKAKTGTTVLTVSTTDVDEADDANKISAMTITAGDIKKDFAIGKDGVITLLKAANMTATATYALTVIAVDSDKTTPRNGTTTVSVIVAEKCSGVGILAASLLTMLVGVMASLSSL